MMPTGVWRDPPVPARALDARAQPDQILIDASVAGLLHSDADIVPGEPIPRLDGDIEVFIVRDPSSAAAARTEVP